MDLTAKGAKVGAKKAKTYSDGEIDEIVNNMPELEKNSIFVQYQTSTKPIQTVRIGTGFEDIISVRSLQDNVVARPLYDAHLATLFNFRGFGL